MWTAPKIDWTTETNIDVALLNAVGNNLRYLKGLDGAVTLDNNFTNLGVNGNISVGGTVDTIDISTHDHSGSAGQGVKIDHGLQLGLADWDHVRHPLIRVKYGTDYDTNTNLTMYGEYKIHSGGSQVIDITVTYPSGFFSGKAVVIALPASATQGDIRTTVYNESASGCTIRLSKHEGTLDSGAIHVIAIGPA